MVFTQPWADSVAENARRTREETCQQVMGRTRGHRKANPWQRRPAVPGRGPDPDFCPAPCSSSARAARWPLPTLTRRGRPPLHLLRAHERRKRPILLHHRQGSMCLSPDIPQSRWTCSGLFAPGHPCSLRAVPTREDRRRGVRAAAVMTLGGKGRGRPQARSERRPESLPT